MNSVAPLPYFVLYGGTALALRLGHRQSEDFDFFSSKEINPSQLLQEIPYLEGAEVLQRSQNTLTCLVDRNGPVHISFFGGLSLCRIKNPEKLNNPAISIASFLDIAAAKAEVVQARAAAKDYIDINALICQADISLSHALGAASAVFGSSFNPMLTLKALSFFDDGDLNILPKKIKQNLIHAVATVDLIHLPHFKPLSGLTP